MFVAHSFAGYLWSRKAIMSLKLKVSAQQLKYYLWFGIFCSILPDLDLMYFYTFDQRQNPHHEYWTHMPFFWILVASILYAVARWIFRKRIGVYCFLLAANTVLHLILDTLAGGIYWLYPFNDAYIVLISILPKYDWWVWNFVLHWVFFSELIIILAAVYVFRRDRLAFGGTMGQYQSM